MKKEASEQSEAPRGTKAAVEDFSHLASKNSIDVSGTDRRVVASSTS